VKPRYLTKSRYKLGIECPTKLFFTGKKEYPDQRLEDPFLAALADGGYQVGELARQYYKGGISIDSLDYTEAEDMTRDLMKRDQVVLYEPAFRYENLFCRIDILVKNRDTLQLIEVKSKSFDRMEDNPFLTRVGKIASGWESYLQDVAFQKYVLEKSCPGFKITSYLMMTDKCALCPTDGLNQKFRIIRDTSNRKGIRVSTTLTAEDVKDKILIQVPVDDYVHMIHGGTYKADGSDVSFAGLVDFLSSHYRNDTKISPQISSRCTNCEFKCTAEQELEGFNNGFKECWKEALEWDDGDFKEPSILELWNYRKKDFCIASGKTKLQDLTPQDINIKSNTVPGLSSSQRQWLQVEKVKTKDTSAYFDKTGMKAEMDSWTFPLHHIDFETARVAIPFNKGRRPYEGIIFQFSHHLVHEDGTVEHAGQFLNADPGIFPNYETVRELKKQLERDHGTIFRYTNHENSYLVEVYKQLLADTNPPKDKDDLCEFIKSITKSDKKSDEWRGNRCMVDLWDLVKKYYHDPATHGSNSIKAVLPAILNSSPYLQGKYSKPIYGAAAGIKSLNYTDWRWVEYDQDGKVKDPYSLIPPVFSREIDQSIELFSEDEELREGGAAMVAYCRMQFSEMSDFEREKLEKALLRYCELDTFAMVMIYEAWRVMIK
jgi:hypothetical protein